MHQKCLKVRSSGTRTICQTLSGIFHTPDKRPSYFGDLTARILSQFSRQLLCQLLQCLLAVFSPELALLLVFHNRTANLPVSGQKLGVDLLCHSGSCVFHQLPDSWTNGLFGVSWFAIGSLLYSIGIPCCRFTLIYQYILFLAESKTPKTRGNVLLALRRHNRAKLSFRTNLIYKISTKVSQK